ncbi:hypothetical protein CERZMDRAFT_110817 [Cercospora zeae-maydis SCOH1-5]|uniref:Cytochrome P450 n=1 Tax=Cercospora zeae-maydis SCOH1-5 TaxID=717836 RepID=A0A6A6FMA6_9PEZI|nr:hypothetical protein CERZMDRAFT_110817 [Cercospora zeae-maydis SCOH1-5]
MAIIAAKHFEGQGLDFENALGRYAARAAPNQRLVRAFGIENSFVVSEKEASQRFRGRVEKKLHVGAEKWVEFAEMARSVATAQISGEGESRNLFDVVQMLSMKMVRKVIWDVDQEGKGVDEKLGVLAKEVNKQWLESKKYDEAFLKAGGEVELPEKLKQVLMDVFGWDGEDRKENPLNFILPGYETIWRVVLRCFLELSARGHPNSGDWTRSLKDFLNTPTPAQLGHGVDFDGSKIYPLMIALEILRLYPPTRRVYRQFEDQNGAVYSIAADIEGMHRDAGVWQDDPLAFRPERWAGISPDAIDSRWFPFGAKPFRCPAKEKSQRVYMPFGVSMIAILTGALLEATEGRWEYSGEKLPDADVPLDTDREAYEKAELHKIKTQA